MRGKEGFGNAISEIRGCAHGDVLQTMSATTSRSMTVCHGSPMRTV